MTSFRVDVLAEDDWPRLRDIRLKALNTDPTVFLASHENEATFAEQQWRQEFARGEWHVMVAIGRLRRGRYVGLVGVTRLPETSSRECYLEYLWVAPRVRRRGVASTLLRAVLDRLYRSDVHTVWLYILDGNEPARRLYQRFGFQSTNDVQPLPDDPTRSEELLRLNLD
ncbi:MAG TPA: GNAT family N-acetyltransferase [Streptosporangiaceae bacterium]|nr:GNAT family N-acetyltransferase [Streptosporangiaceae bacterium]